MQTLQIETSLDDLVDELDSVGTLPNKQNLVIIIRKCDNSKVTFRFLWDDLLECFCMFLNESEECVLNLKGDSILDFNAVVVASFLNLEN